MNLTKPLRIDMSTVASLTEGQDTKHGSVPSASAPPARLPDPAEFSPLMASVWADAVVAYWRIACAEGRLDLTQPLDVLDLRPGCGASVWQMVQALRRRLSELPEFTGALRYLMVGPKRELLTGLRSQPELQADLKAGTLVPVLWDPDRGDPCMLYPGKRVTWHPANPVAVLAHDSWAHLEQRLCAVHYGKLLEADVGRLANCARPVDEGKEWKPVQPGRLGEDLVQLVQGYLQKFNSVPIPLPTGATGQIQRIASLAPNGYLILAAASGLVSERQIRLHHFSDLLAHYRQCSTMPVNFYLLGQYCAAMAASSWQAEMRPGLAMQVIAGNLPQHARYVSAASVVLESGAACDAPALVEAARIIAATRSVARLDMLLALIRRSEHDPAVFAIGASAIMDSLRSKPARDRNAWAEALGQVWSRHLPSPTGAPLHRSLAPAAMRMSAWGLARKALTRGIQVHGEHALDLAHLAWCEMRTGRGYRALAIIKRAAVLDETDATVQEVLQTVSEKHSSWRGGWQASLSSDRLPIALEPLDAGHAEALWHQYRDPHIAIMTGLPALPTLEATRAWLGEHRADASRKPYAVLHRDHGFIGYVCLSVSQHEAYFCFWIGADFQGAGFSVEAARLACCLARQQGVSHVYTSAYQDNARSLGALERSGFTRLPIQALPPESDRIFLFLNLSDIPVNDPVLNLAAYYEQEKLPLYFPGQESRQEADRIAAKHAAGTEQHGALAAMTE